MNADAALTAMAVNEALKIDPTSFSCISAMNALRSSRTESHEVGCGRRTETAHHVTLRGGIRLAFGLLDTAKATPQSIIDEHFELPVARNPTKRFRLSIFGSALPRFSPRILAIFWPSFREPDSLQNMEAKKYEHSSGVTWLAE